MIAEIILAIVLTAVVCLPIGAWIGFSMLALGLRKMSPEKFEDIIRRQREEHHD